MKLTKQHLHDYKKFGIIKIKLSKEILKKKKFFIDDTIEFFKKNNFELKKFNFTPTPGAYFIKK